MQIDVGSLVSQIQDMQKKNAELEEQRTVISSKVSFCLISPHLCRICRRKHHELIVYLNFVIITLFQLQSKEAENGMLQKRLNELVINALPN